MSTDNTKAMQEALNAAVKQMNGSGAVHPPTPVDPMSMLMTVLPRLIPQPGQDDGDELGEKVDGVQKDLGGVRAEVLVLRKQVHRVFKMQEQILAQLAELQEQQLAVNQAILDLAGHMARVEILEDPDDQGRDERGSSAPSARPPRAGRSPRK